MAPVAIATSEVNFSGYTAAYEFRSIGIDNLANKFVSRHAGKAIVSPLKLEICVANSGAEQLDECESSAAFR
jgi:hypothetical protein